MFRTIVFSFLLLTSFSLFAKESPQRLTLNKLFGQSKDNFKISGCEKFNLNPTEIFKSFKYKTHFSKNCDIQGEVALKIFMPFLLEMELKNLSHYKKLSGTAKLNLGMENPPRILGELTKATLQGKDSIYFNAYYSGEVLPASTIKVKPGTERVRIEILDKTFSKKIDEFTMEIQ